MWAAAELETCVATVGALAAGAPVVPINPKAGERELAHIVRDSEPSAVLAAGGAELPRRSNGAAARIELEAGRRGDLPGERETRYGGRASSPTRGAGADRLHVGDDRAAEGRRAAAPSDRLEPRRARATHGSGPHADVLVHGLPLFHVHGLVIGVLGPLRRGGALRHLGGVLDRRRDRATLSGGGDDAVRRADDVSPARATRPTRTPRSRRRSAGARLLVSGSAALPAAEHERIERASGQRVVERYGMTETLMNTSVRADGERRPGRSGSPLPGVELRLVDDDGETIERATARPIGEIHVRGPNLFLEYLNRPDATAEALRDGWFRTGDVATREPDGYIRLSAAAPPT